MNNYDINSYDASLCLALADRAKNYIPPWSREYTTFNVIDSNLINKCPSEQERLELQYNYKLGILKNHNRLNINLSKKQQYANLVKNGHYSKNQTYASLRNPNVSNLEKKNNTLYVCPGKTQYRGPTQFAGPRLYLNKH